MNLLENWIENIHHEKAYIIKSKIEEYGTEATIEAIVTYNCYGNVKTGKVWMSLEKWKEAKERGYFMA